MDATTLLDDRAQPAPTLDSRANADPMDSWHHDDFDPALGDRRKVFYGYKTCESCSITVPYIDWPPEDEQPPPWPGTICDECSRAEVELHHQVEQLIAEIDADMEERAGTYAPTLEEAEAAITERRTDANGWPLCLPDDRIAVADGDPIPPPPPPPDVLGVIYSDKRNVLAGEPASGKTWLAMECAAHIVEVMAQRVVWLDAEDSAHTFSERMTRLGHRDLTSSALLKRVNHSDWLDADELDRAAVSAWLADGPTGSGHLFIDSGTATDSGISADDYAAWAVRHAVHIGMTVIEHVAKNPEQRFGPLGSTRKNQSATGITAMIEGAAWTPATPAAVNLRVVKDRPGGTGRQKGDLYATVYGDPHDDGTVTITVRPPLEESDAYAGLIDAAVRDDPGIGANDLRDAVTEAAKLAGVRSDWQTVVAEIKQAVKSGLIVKVEGKGRRVHHYPADHSQANV